MKSEDTLFDEMVNSLDEGTRDLVNNRRAASDSWWRSRSHPYYRFVAYFHILASDDHLETFNRLENLFARWLEEQGDCWGTFLLHHQTVRNPAWREPFTLADDRAGVEDAFIQELSEHPGEATPCLIFADWLEERDDPRGPLVRWLAHVRILSRRIERDWVEDFLVPVPDWPSARYQRFNDPPRRVMQIARQESQRLNHDYIGTQHILLALLQGFGVASAILASEGVHQDNALREVAKITRVRPGTVLVDKLPHSQRAATILCYAIEEADHFGHEMVSPEHLLLSMCRANPCAATRTLQNLGVSTAAVCRRVVASFSADPGSWVRKHPEVW
jgi:uncharacterized protein (TIGR02996 family)